MQGAVLGGRSAECALEASWKREAPVLFGFGEGAAGGWCWSGRGSWRNDHGIKEDSEPLRV